MDNDRARKRAETLERTLENHFVYLEKNVETFQKRCLSILPQKSIPLDVVINVREDYKDIQKRFTEVKATQHLLREKYRSYARKDSLREREFAELESLAATYYSRFEYTLIQLRDEEMMREEEGTEEEGGRGGAGQAVPFQWFRIKENQEIFLRDLQTVRDLNHGKSTGAGDRREVTPSPSTHDQPFTLFVFTGDDHFLDELQRQIHLRERDIIERFSNEELRGVLIHRREVDPFEMESILQRFMRKGPFSRLKCLFARIEAQRGAGKEVVDLIEKNLQEMTEGEVRSLSI